MVETPSSHPDIVLTHIEEKATRYRGLSELLIRKVALCNTVLGSRVVWKEERGSCHRTKCEYLQTPQQIALRFP